WSLDPTARTVSSSAGMARGSLSRPSANAAAAWTAGTESLSTGISRSTAAPSPLRPAARAAWRRTPGFAWLNASRSGAPSTRRAEERPRRRQTPQPAADSNHIIIARRLAVTDVHIGDGEVGALLLQLLVGHPAFAEVLRPRHVHPDEIVRVIHEPHLIGFGVI